MNILFLISILSFCVLGWTIFSIARHVRRGLAHAAEPLQAAVAQRTAPGKSPRRKLART